MARAFGIPFDQVMAMRIGDLYPLLEMVSERG